MNILYVKCRACLTEFKPKESEKNKLTVRCTDCNANNMNTASDKYCGFCQGKCKGEHYISASTNGY